MYITFGVTLLGRVYSEDVRVQSFEKWISRQEYCLKTEGDYVE
jgi:hypothetical protein